MRALAGAVVILAAAVLAAGGLVSDGLIFAANRLGSAGSGLAYLGAGALGLLGFVILVLGSVADAFERGQASPAARRPPRLPGEEP